ncbi:MAG: peptidyl-prolyl cis-trans isomerase [Candidatus Hydrogenedentes bacterium]|nr:peptidyl-prolyl cis-trans isomerase [Candidatus Hydrogenedentota bacterium]
MPDIAPDRLKEFRAQNQPAPAKSSLRPILLSSLVTAVVVSAALLVGLPYVLKEKNNTAGAGGLTTDQWREYAAYLADKKLNSEAIAAYDKYLDRATLEPGARAKICYSVATLAVDTEQFDRALAYLYQAEKIDPNSDLKSEIDKKIVFCLDKTGRSADLRRELKKRTSPKRTAADLQTGETIIAEFAGEVITDRDLEAQMDRLPVQVRQSIESPEKKADFLKNIVVERLLVDKALRLGLEKDPKVEQDMAGQRNALIVRKLIENEVQSKVTVTPEDVQRFYNAETKRFTQPATAQVKIGEADTEAAAKSLTDFPKDPVTVSASGRIPGLPDAPEATKSIFAADAGATTAPLQIEDRWYVFQVISKTPAKTPAFDEVKPQAEKMFRRQKEQEQVNALIEDTLKARDVKLYPERLKKEEDKS